MPMSECTGVVGTGFVDGERGQLGSDHNHSGLENRVNQ